MSDYPVFTITKIDENPNSLSAFGLIDRKEQGKEKWVDDGWVGVLFTGNKVAFGRWHRQDNLWQFKFDSEEIGKIEIQEGKKVSILEGYWGERVEIALDERIEWKEVVFHTEGNWDHDHCAICWAAISEVENTRYFLGNSRHPVCPECYKKHVSVRDISFVPNA